MCCAAIETLTTEPTLRRTLNLPLLVFYGLGSIVGAGIYVLIGEVAAVSGQGMALAFLVAGIIAIFTGLTYAELSSRFPQSAGAALFVDIAFRQPWLTQLVAWMLIFTGIVSSATISNGFVGYFQIFFDTPRAAIIIGLCVFMCGIACWGIRQSAWIVAAITLLEVSGLMLVVFVTQQLEPRYSMVDILQLPVETTAIVTGAFIAFYAFIGFEDMVNVAEEVRDPEANMPRGIIISLLLAAVAYFLIAAVALAFVDPAELSGSSSPLAMMVGHNTLAVLIISAISLLAVVNGALVQIIMCARIMFGMAVRGLLPNVFRHLNRTTRTPVGNTVLTTLVVLVLALEFSLVELAKVTSTFMLVIFVIVNLSLLRIRFMNRLDDPHGGFKLPFAVPVVSLAAALALLSGHFLL